MRLGTQVQPDADRKKALLLTVDKSVTRQHQATPSTAHEAGTAVGDDSANRHKMHSSECTVSATVALQRQETVTSAAEYTSTKRRQTAANSSSILGVLVQHTA